MNQTLEFFDWISLFGEIKCVFFRVLSPRSTDCNHFSEPLFWGKGIAMLLGDRNGDNNKVGSPVLLPAKDMENSLPPSSFVSLPRFFLLAATHIPPCSNPTQPILWWPKAKWLSYNCHQVGFGAGLGCCRIKQISARFCHRH